MARIFARVRLAAILVLCCAWAATGHKVVVQIAYDHLTRKAQADVDKLVGTSTLAEFPVWADQIKSDPAWAWSKRRHFANMRADTTEFKFSSDCPDHGCVVTQPIQGSRV